ncbi:MAG TPA: HD domain-containing phosphohydrolase [Gemmatimonadaceae bacterium]
MARGVFRYAAGALLALAVTVGVLDWLARRFDRELRRSGEVVRVARQAYELSLDREAAVRGFLLTGDSSALAPELVARLPLSIAIDSLAVLTENDPAQSQRTGTIRASITRWANVVAFPALRKPDRARARSEQAELIGNTLFETVRWSFVNLLQAEEAIYNARQRRQERMRVFADLAIAFELMVLLAVLIRARRRTLRQAIEIAHAEARAREAQLEVLTRLAAAGEARDDDTGQHTRRVGELAARIAEALGLSCEEVDLIRLAAPLHDVGKIGIPDSILRKPGPLTADEFAVMQKHTVIGAEMLADGATPHIRMAEAIARSHHEWWNGGGYPDGLAGSAIPLAARIVAVADVYDALTHARPYRRAWSRDRVIGELRRKAGTHFEPRVVEAFLEGVLSDRDTSMMVIGPEAAKGGRMSVMRRPSRQRNLASS